MEHQATLEERVAATEAAVGLNSDRVGSAVAERDQTVPFTPGVCSLPMRIAGADAPTIDATCRLLAYAVYMARGRGRENPHESIEMIEWALKAYLQDPRSLNADRMGWGETASRQTA